MMRPRYILIAAVMAIAVGTVAAKMECDQSVRRVDGYCNNAAHPERGMTGTAFIRGAEGNGYVDGLTQRRDGPNPRDVSNTIGSAVSNQGNPRGHTVKFGYEGQFIAHDLALTRIAETFSLIDITDLNDPLYSLSPRDPPSMKLDDTFLDTDAEGVAQSINDVSHYLDLTQVYGATEARENALRSFSGGRLKTSSYIIEDESIAPGKTFVLEDGLPNTAETGLEPGPAAAANNPPESHLTAGDIRADENCVLAMNHRTWLLRHNHHADDLATENPGWTDEQLYTKAKHLTIAEYQHIVWDEFLRALIGEIMWRQISEYTGYESDTDPSIGITFATSGWRFGHSLIPKRIVLVDALGHEYGSIPHAGLFHGALNPLSVHLVTGGDDNLGLSVVSLGADEMDEKFSESMRSLPDPFDILAANLLRERMNGLPTFDKMMEVYDPGHGSVYDKAACAPTAPPSIDPDSVECFMYISSSKELATKLRSIYGKVADMDPYIGFVSQNHFMDSLLGRTHTMVIIEQFLRLREGDWWWYENLDNGALTPAELATVKETTYADIMHEELGIARWKLQDFVFFSPSALSS